MAKASIALIAAASLLVSAPGAALAAPKAASLAINPSEVIAQGAVMKLPRCTKERTTNCRAAKDGKWIIVGVVGLAALAALAVGGSGKSSSP